MNADIKERFFENSVHRSRDKRDYSRSSDGPYSPRWRGRERSPERDTSHTSNDESRSYSRRSSKDKPYDRDDRDDRSRRRNRTNYAKSDQYPDYRDDKPTRWNGYERERHRSVEARDIDERVGRRGPDEDQHDSCGSFDNSLSGDSRLFNIDSETYRNQPPNSTIMLRGLAQHIGENDIRQNILQCGLMPKDIRLIRKKDTGTSRGFGFVEFNTVEEAARWMELKQGVLMLHEQYRAVMHFSIPKGQSFNERQLLKCSLDWYCSKCGAHNFKRRDSCFKCQTNRQDSDAGEGSEEVTHTPTQTVLLRGLDALSTEDSVRQALEKYSFSYSNIRIGRDTLTHTSRGMCYLEAASQEQATQIYDDLIANPPTIDGRLVLTSYSKPPVAWPARNDIQVINTAGQYTMADIPRLADYSASLYATSASELASYQQYYRHYYQSQIAQGGGITLASAQPNQMFPINSATELARSAIQHAMASKEATTVPAECNAGHSYYPNAIPSTSSTCKIPFVSSAASQSGYPKYPIPDVSTYQWDDSSGYYCDPHTGLFYDATTQYYFNSVTKQFLYWDSTYETYLPSPDSPSLVEVSKVDPKKTKGSSDKVKVAKKIAKDMERWAKTLNQKKDGSFRSPAPMPATAVASSAKRKGGAADAGYAVLERKEAPPASGEGLVAAYGGGSESDDEIEDVLEEEKQHIHWDTMACLLCKRQFANKETLLRHQLRSDLHKQNLAEWYKVRGLDPDDPQQRNSTYRDRAKERRLKFGEPNAPQPNTLKEKFLKAREDAVSVSYEEPTKGGIGTSNVGNKMLMKMGWQEGMGLGKSNQGRTSIIQTKQRVSSAGLGAKGGTYGVLPGETYKDCVKKMMFARYQELTEQESEAPNDSGS